MSGRPPALDTIPVRVRDGTSFPRRVVAAAFARLGIGAHRYAFGREALRVRAWHGWREQPWASAEAARLVDGPRGVELVVTFRPRTLLRIPLMAYHGSARLLLDLENRLPVAVSAPNRLRERLEAADA